MKDEQLLERVILDPKVMVGKPVIKGTRLTVDYILNLLAHGSTTTEILEEYQGLTVEDVQACLLFATKSLEREKGERKELRPLFRLRFHTAALAIAVLLVAHATAGELHEMPEHGLRASLPSGWQRIEALSGNTVLKLARTDTPGKEARIVIVALLAEETVHLSTISRDDHIRALEGDSMLGEKVSVINVGRTKVGGLDALWGKTYRNLPSRGSTYEYIYEFVREYKGVPKAFTIRLTSYGNERWFQANSVVFDGFIQSVRFKSHPKTVRSSPEPARLEIAEAEPFWLALFKGFGKVFLLILLATIAVGVGKWVYSKYVASAGG